MNGDQSQLAIELATTLDALSYSLFSLGFSLEWAAITFMKKVIMSTSTIFMSLTEQEKLLHAWPFQWSSASSISY